MSHYVASKSIRLGIIGIGVAGLASLIQILSEPRLYKRVKQIFMFDPNVRGRTLPYSHDSTGLLMNTSVGVNSIREEAPQHFYHWLLKTRTEWKPKYPTLNRVNLSSFVPRRLFGDYLVASFHEAIQEAKKKGVDVQWIRQYGSQVFSEKNKQVVQTDLGNKYSVDYIIMGPGKAPLSEVTYQSLNKTPNYLPSPYQAMEVYQQIPKIGSVLVIGSHLSAIDSFRLLRENGFKGKIVFCSQSGSFPAVRTEALKYRKIIHTYQQFEDLETLSTAFNQVIDPQLYTTPEQDFQFCIKDNVEWQKHIVPFIFRVNEVWQTQKTSDKEQFLNLFDRRFVRFISAYPQQIARRLLSEIKQGSLHIEKGLETINYDGESGDYKAIFGGNHQENKFDYVINATNRGEQVLPETLSLFNSFKNFELDENFRLLSHPKIYIAGLAAKSQFPIINAVCLIVTQVKKVILSLANDVEYEYENDYHSFYQTDRICA